MNLVLAECRYTEEVEARTPASSDELDKLSAYALQTYDRPLPADYIDFLGISDGCWGRGPHLHVILDRAEDVPRLTADYGAVEFCPGLLVIGTDGSGNILGIDMCDRSLDRYVRMDACNLDWDEGSCYCGTLSELLNCLGEEVNHA